MFVDTIRSWAIVNSLEDCEVEGNCCCNGQLWTHWGGPYDADKALLLHFPQLSAGPYDACKALLLHFPQLASLGLPRS